MNDIHPQNAIEIAAQIWCKPEHASEIMNPALAKSFADELEKEQAHTDAWYETAAMHARNEAYYRGIVVEIWEMLGPEAYISDDGSVQQDILCAKVSELVRKRLNP